MPPALPREGGIWTLLTAKAIIASGLAPVSFGYVPLDMALQLRCSGYKEDQP